MYSCRCYGHHREFENATLEDHPHYDNRTPSATSNSLFARNKNTFSPDYYSDSRRHHWKDEWFEITGEVSLSGMEQNHRLVLKVRDVKNNHEIRVGLQRPDDGQPCEIRREMIRWSGIRIDLAGSEARHSFISNPIVTLTGKAFYSSDYGIERRRAFSLPPFGKKRKSNIAIWEIQPVFTHHLIHGA